MPQSTHEKWRPMVGFEGVYDVSDQGRMRSLSREESASNQFGPYTRKRKGRILAPHTNQRTGITLVQLCHNGNPFTRTVSRLVMAAFVGGCPEGKEVAHNNGKPWDNRLNNLRYATPEENAADRLLHGTDCRGEKNGNSKLTWGDVYTIRALHGHVPSRRVASMYAVTKTLILKIWRRDAWGYERA
ncbi:MAG: NUMOD4 motif-containing HNH endonuclease [Geminicoccaceae bacterium]